MIEESTPTELMAQEDLALLVSQQKDWRLAQQAAQIEELKYNLLIQQIKAKYGLTDKDTVDSATGLIKRA